MAYRPKPSTPRICVYCQTVYHAKDRRRMYCSSSCNTLAWLARRTAEQVKSPLQNKLASGQLAFSLKNVATIGAGVIAADTTKAVLNALFEVQPTNSQVMEKLDQMQQLVVATIQQQQATRQQLHATTQLVGDVLAGVALSSEAAKKVIAVAQTKRGVAGPKQPPKSPPGPSFISHSGR